MQQSSQSSARPVDGLTYNEANAELESIVRALESNQLELEESPIVTSDAAVGVLRARLTEAEQKVGALMGEIEIESDERDTTLS